MWLPGCPGGVRKARPRLPHASESDGVVLGAWRVRLREVDAVGVARLPRAAAVARPRVAGDLTAGPARRRYVNPGDTILLVLPDTERCRRANLAGRRTRVHVTAVDAEFD